MAETPRSKPRYKLTYFDGKGRAEPIRLLFKAAAVPFQDERITFEQWPARKPTTPYGSLPVLEIEKEQFAETLSILRWGAKKFGMSGKSDRDELLVDAATQQIFELYSPFFTWCFFTKDPKEKEENLPEMKEKIDKVLTRWEGKAKQSKAPSRTYTYLAGTSLTVADLVLFHILDEISNCDMAEKFELSRFPKLLNLKATVASLPRIKEYLATRS